jgi:hypothetical protein
MSGSANRGWAAFSLIGIALWVGVTVLVAVVGEDPSDGGDVALAFAGGGAAFFTVVFGFAWWQTRPRTDPELDALLSELSLDPVAGPGRAAAIGGMRRTARAYIALGALITALGLAAIAQEGLGVGSPRATLFAIVTIVVAWAAAVPLVLRRARGASEAVLGPLGLAQQGATIAGERHGRRVSVALGPKGSVTRVASDVEPEPLDGAEAVLAYAGRGGPGTWEGVELGYERGAITVRRDGHRGASWLWDLWLAERLASGVS